jgi:hypothetical protein
MVIKKAVLLLSLLLFTVSSVPGAERFLDFEPASQVLTSTDTPDSFDSSYDLSGLFNRLVRGKLSIKSLPSFGVATDQIPLTAWINETSCPPFYKYSVFQRISVLRL